MLMPKGPRMFFHGFAGVPEWAPPRENHILYSRSVLKNVIYATGNVQYTPTDSSGTEYLRLAFLPSSIHVGGVVLTSRSDLNAEGYTVRDLGNGDYAVNIRRERAGDVVISSGLQPPRACGWSSDLPPNRSVPEARRDAKCNRRDAEHIAHSAESIAKGAWWRARNILRDQECPI